MMIHMISKKVLQPPNPKSNTAFSKPTDPLGVLYSFTASKVALSYFGLLSGDNIFPTCFKTVSNYSICMQSDNENVATLGVAPRWGGRAKQLKNKKK